MMIPGTDFRLHPTAAELLSSMANEVVERNYQVWLAFLKIVCVRYSELCFD